MKNLLNKIKTKVTSAYRYIREYISLSILELKKWWAADCGQSVEESIGIINSYLSKWGVGSIEVDGGEGGSVATDSSIGSVSDRSSKAGASATA